MKSRFGFVAALLLFPMCIRAQTTVTWILDSSGNWSTDTSWLLNAGPANGDIVVFDDLAGGTSTIDESLTLAGMQFTVAQLGPLTLNETGGNTITISSGDVISYGALFNVNLNVPILGAGGLWLNGGTGTVTLNPGASSNTYTGSTEIFGGGTLSDGEANSYSASSIMYVGSVGSGAGTVLVNFNETIAGLNDGGANGSVQIANGKTLTLTGVYSTTFSGVISDISGHGSLTMNGPGTLTLEGANTYSGTTTINNGGAINIGGGGSTGSIVSNVVGTGTGTLSFDLSTPYSYGGNLSGTLNIVQEGTGTTTLTGTNTNTGPTTINFGTLQAGSTTAFGPMSEVTINGSGVLDLNNYNNTIYALSGSGFVTLGTGVGGTLTVGGGLGPFINTTYSGVISGNGGLTFNNYEQVLTLTGANTYSGTTTINQGTLEIGNDGTTGSIGSGPIATVVNGYIEFARSDTNTYANVISGSGSVEVANGTVTLTGANTYSEFTDVNSATLIVGTAFNGSSGSLGNGSTTVNLTSGTNPAILDLNNLNTKIGVIDGDSSSQLQLGSAALTIQDIAGTDNMAGTITGTGSITMIVGTFNATGNANTYSGGTTINGGTLVALNTLSTSSATGTGPITINGGGGSFLSIGDDTASGYLANVPISDNGVIQFARTDTTTFPNTISGTGSIDVQDGGTVTLTGNNSYTGDTAIDAATLKAGSSTALGSDTALSFNFYGGTLDLNGNNISVGSVTGGSITYPSYINLGSNTLTIGGIPGTTTLTTIISGTGGITLTGPATEQTYLTAIDTYSGPTVIGTGAVLGLGFSSTAGTIPDTSGISGSGTLLFYEPSATTESAPITGSLSVTQIGAGTITLSGNNTYSGPTTVNAGILQAGSSTAFGNGLSAVTVNTGGTLALNGFNDSVGSIAGSGSISLGSGTLTTGAANATTTFSGVISGSGGFEEVGTGETILTGANTYSGLTSVNSGTLSDGGGTSFSPASQMLVNTGATLDVNSNEVVANLQNGTTGGNVVIGPGVSLTSDGANYVGDFNGSISGAGSFIINGGTQGLSGANTFSGGVTLESGELYIGGNSAVGTGTLTLDAGTNIAPEANATLSNPVVLSGSGYVINNWGPSNLTLTGTVSGTAELSWCTTNTLTLTGNNTFTGGIDMREGILLLGSDTGAGVGGTIILDSSTILAAYGGPGITRTIANPIDFTGSSAAFGNNDDNYLVLTGAISGGGAVAFQGGPTGTLTLSPSSNSYSGNFEVASGTVFAANNNALSSAASVLLAGSATLNVENGVTVSSPLIFSGAPNTLAGDGTFSSTVTAGSSTIISPSASPGGGPGSLTFSNGLVLASGVAIHFDLYDANGAAGTGYSLITASGGLDLTASANTVTFNIVTVNSSGGAANAINFNPALPYSWTFATSPTTISGFTGNQFDLITAGFTNNTNGGTFSIADTGTDLTLNFTPVPEPSTWAMLGAGMLAVVPLALRRRRVSRA